jgi:hypothetical protein
LAGWLTYPLDDKVLQYRRRGRWLSFSCMKRRNGGRLRRGRRRFARTAYRQKRAFSCVLLVRWKANADLKIMGRIQIDMPIRRKLVAVS